MNEEEKTRRLNDLFGHAMYVVNHFNNMYVSKYGKQFKLKLENNYDHTGYKISFERKGFYYDIEFCINKFKENSKNNIYFLLGTYYVGYMKQDSKTYYILFMQLLKKCFERQYQLEKITFEDGEKVSFPSLLPVLNKIEELRNFSIN